MKIELDEFEILTIFFDCFKKMGIFRPANEEKIFSFIKSRYFSHGNENTITPLSELNLSTRANNILRNMGIYTIETLKLCSWKDIQRNRDCGKITLFQIMAALSKKGFKLSGDMPPKVAEEFNLYLEKHTVTREGV